jgi:hypothetical protein
LSCFCVSCQEKKFPLPRCRPFFLEYAENLFPMPHRESASRRTPGSGFPDRHWHPDGYMSILIFACPGRRKGHTMLSAQLGHFL